MEVQVNEENSCGCAGQDKIAAIAESQTESSTVTPHGYAANNAATTEAMLIISNDQHHGTARNKCASGIDESKEEIETRTSLYREDCSINNSSDSQEQPNENESLSAPLRIKSDNLRGTNPVDGVETVSTALDVMKTAGTSGDCSNMAHNEPGSCVSIEMGGVAERNDCAEKDDKISQATEETIIYICESDNLELESDVCRICHSGEEAEVLISPCLCTGSVKFVHHSCLMSWLQRAVMSKCELCLYPLAVKRKTKPLKKWRLPEDKPFPILWLFTFVVAMTLNVASIAKDGSQRCVSDPCIIFYVLGSAGALLGLAFFYHWLRKTLRYFAKWMALNQEWSLVGPYDFKSRLGQTNLACSSKSLSQTEATIEQIA